MRRVLLALLVCACLGMEAQTVAVLPLFNSSGDENLDWIGESVAETVTDMRHAFIDDVVAKHIPEHAYAEQWDMAKIAAPAAWDSQTGNNVQLIPRIINEDTFGSAIPARQHFAAGIKFRKKEYRFEKSGSSSENMTRTGLFHRISASLVARISAAAGSWARNGRASGNATAAAL